MHSRQAPGRRAMRVWRRGGGAVIFATLAAAFAAVPVWAAGPQLKLVREATAPNEPIKVKAYVYSRVPLGAYTLQLSFDPSAFQLLEISGGSAAEFASAPISNPAKFAGGVVRFSAFQVARKDGPTGRIHVATFTLRPRSLSGTPGLQIQAITLADTSGGTYQPPRHAKVLRFHTH